MPRAPDITSRGRTIARYIGNGVLIVLGTAAAAVVLYFLVIIGSLVLGLLVGLWLARVAARMMSAHALTDQSREPAPRVRRVPRSAR